MAASARVLGITSILALAVVAPDPGDDLLEPGEYAWRLTRHTRQRYAADLDEVRRRGVLRVLTRNNSVSYYIARGQQRGFEYELASYFAEALGVRVAFVVPETRGELFAALYAGEGDLIAAGTSVTPAREEKVAFTRPYIDIQRVVATRSDHPGPVASLEDLPGLTIHLSFRSTTLQDMREVEAALGKPVISSNLALAWRLRVLAGLPVAGAGPGRLFAM